MRVLQYESKQYSSKKPIKWLLIAVSTVLFFGCGNPGFTSKAGDTDGGSGHAPGPILPTLPTALKSSGIEVVTGAVVNVMGKNGSKASISVGDVSTNKLKSAKGYQVFLSVSGQNSSAQ